MYKVDHNLVPDATTDMFQLTTEVHNYNIRSTAARNYYVHDAKLMKTRKAFHMLVLWPQTNCLMLLKRLLTWHWWVLIWHETYDHWSVALLTVTVYFIYSHFWFCFQISFFMHWIQSVNPISFITLYYNGSPYFCDSWVGYSAGWIFVAPEVALNLALPSIFSGLAALISMSADCAKPIITGLQLSKQLPYTSFIPAFDLFFRYVAFCTKFNLLTSFSFITLYYNGSPYFLNVFKAKLKVYLLENDEAHIIYL